MNSPFLVRNPDLQTYQADKEKKMPDILSVKSENLVFVEQTKASQSATNFWEIS